jgi:hypothetical protein
VLYIGKKSKDGVTVSGVKKERIWELDAALSAIKESCVENDRLLSAYYGKTVRENQRIFEEFLKSYNAYKEKHGNFGD